MPAHIQILLLPETMLSSLAGPLDLFSTAGSFWPALMGEPPEPLFTVELVSVTRQAMEFAGGLTIQPHCDVSRAGPADLVYIPSITIMPEGELPASADEARDWLRGQHAAGAMLCSACTGSFVLAETGLLEGLPATTHWAFEQAFRARFPNIKLKENAVMVVNEDAQLATAGANASWQDLILYVMGRFGSPRAVEQARRLFLIDGHDYLDGNQGAYSRSNLEVTGADREVAQAQAWLQSHLSEPNPVEQVIERSVLPGRTLKRRFKKHLGKTIIAYVQMLRVDTAKGLLLDTAGSIDDISYTVGYRDASYFRRIFKRDTGITPGRYREKYRGPNRY